MRADLAPSPRKDFQARPTFYAARLVAAALSLLACFFIIGCQSRDEIHGPRPSNANEENLRVSLQNADSRPGFKVDEGGSFTDTYEFNGTGGCTTGKHTVSAPTAARLKMKLCWRLSHPRLNNDCAEAERREHYVKVCSN
jgi:hypothetical protein